MRKVCKCCKKYSANEYDYCVKCWNQFGDAEKHDKKTRKIPELQMKRNNLLNHGFDEIDIPRYFIVPNKHKKTKQTRLI